MLKKLGNFTKKTSWWLWSNYRTKIFIWQICGINNKQWSSKRFCYFLIWIFEYFQQKLIFLFPVLHRKLSHDQILESEWSLLGTSFRLRSHSTIWWKKYSFWWKFHNLKCSNVVSEIWHFNILSESTFLYP